MRKSWDGGSGAARCDPRTRRRRATTDLLVRGGRARGEDAGRVAGDTLLEAVLGHTGVAQRGAARGLADAARHEAGPNP
eukprot:1769115-Alexandrium_andersonii.AAC.1